MAAREEARLVLEEQPLVSYDVLGLLPKRRAGYGLFYDYVEHIGSTLWLFEPSPVTG
jgi:hypothetical protein